MKQFLYAALLSTCATSTLYAQIQLNEDRVVLRNEVAVNSANLDFSPAFYKDGVVFVTTDVELMKYRIEDERIGTNVMKLYHADRNKAGILLHPQLFYSELTSDLHEGPVTFTQDYQTIYFTRNDEENHRFRRRDLRRLRVYTATFNGNRWTEERLAPFNTEGANTAHPALSPDGSMLIFASDREGGYGGMDLWATKKTGDSWGTPFNLGPTINGAGDEVFPFLHADGTLYFAAKEATETPTSENDKKASQAVADLDIYFARPGANGWAVPQALGAPFNTDADDFGIIVTPDNKRGYFSSNREGGLGADDIYGFEIYNGQQGIGVPVEIALSVKDASSGKGLQGAVVQYVNTSDISVADAIASGVISTNRDGELVIEGSEKLELGASGTEQITLPSGDYYVVVSKPGYTTKQVPLSFLANASKHEIMLSPAASCREITVQVVNQESFKPAANAFVKLDGQESGALNSVRVDASGKATVCMPCGDNFSVKAERGTSISAPVAYSTQLKCGENQPELVTLFMGSGAVVNTSPNSNRGAVSPQNNGNPLVEQTVFQLPNVYYAYNDWRLTGSAKEDLEHLAVLMRQYPDMRIELGSHTDARGNREYNRKLSQRRADEAMRFLTQEAGIDRSRVTGVGYGESEIRNRCVDGVSCSEAEHALNRRTEVTITDVQNPVAVADFVRSQTENGYFTETTYPRQEESTSSPVRQPEVIRPTPTARQDLGRGFWVVAGTFRNEREAEDFGNQLRAMGYQNVSTTRFANGGSHSVVVERFNDLGTAKNLIQTLRNAHDVVAFVRKID